MSSTPNPLRMALAEVLGRTGFARKGGSWFRRNDEVIEVVNLQKSQYGNQYYLNYGLWLLALGEKAFPREEQCHIQMRGDAIVSSEAQYRHLLDLDSDVDDARRGSRFATLLGAEFVPFAGSCQTASGLRSLLQTGKLTKALLHVAAKETLMALPV